MKTNNHTPESDFLKEVEHHKMTIIRDDGVYRHIRFKAPKTMCMHFDLITWPGYLCYTGDMGTYVFSRIEDMFEFFRTDRNSDWLKSKGLTLGINKSYWAEKVEAKHRDGIKEFSSNKFDTAVKEYLINWLRDHREKTSKEERRALWDEVMDEIIGADNDSGGFRKQAAANDFFHSIDNGKITKGFYFQDFHEYSVEEYTHRFTWCCYALAWSIQVYDQAKAVEQIQAETKILEPSQ